MTKILPAAGAALRVPKIVGSDTELGNYIEGIDRPQGTGSEAARLLLETIDGPPSGRSYRRQVVGWGWTTWHGGPTIPAPSAPAYDPQDSGRRYQLTSGGCVYEDLSHYESCLPEVRSASDFVAATHASFWQAQEAMDAVNAHLPADRKVVVLANNSDGHVSWGSHLNVLVSRRAFSAIIDRPYPAGMFFGSYQVSSMLFTGQGKVGAENGQPWTDYQISQRADYVETFIAERTTWRRPLINSRDEAHCGDVAWAGDRARLHIINFDNNLQQVASYLKCGATQIVLAMIEAEQIDRDLILEDPVEMMWRWSRDPHLRTTGQLLSGRRVTAVEHQQLIAERAARFVEAGECEGYVPEAQQILERWQDTLAVLERRDFDEAARRLDWVLRRSLLERALSQHSSLDWRSDQLKLLDLAYSSLAEGGLYLACAPNTERVVSDGLIQRFLHEPPNDTRAWTRAQLLRAARAADVEVEKVNWDSISLECPRPGGGYGSTTRTVSLPDPAGHTRLDVERDFKDARSFDELLDRLGATSA